MAGRIGYTPARFKVRNLQEAVRMDENNPFVRHDVGTGNLYDRADPFEVASLNQTFQNARLPIPAARKLSAVFLKLIPTFELRAVKPYEPSYLANWPAEVYDIPMAEASLDARAQALARYKNDLPVLLEPVKLISASSADMSVESFRLTLLPVWMTELPFGGRTHLVLINGLNGEVRNDLPEKKEKSSGLMDWLGDLLEG